MTTLCPYCFSDKSLRRRLQEIRPNYPRTEKCDHHPNRSGIPIEAISPLIDAVISPYYHFGESNSYSGQEGESLEDIICDLTGAETDDIVRDLIDQLVEDDPADPRDGDEPFYQEDQLYVRHDSLYNPHSEAWEKFKSEITYNQRFFSDLARGRLQQIFHDIHFQKDRAGKPVVYKLSADDQISIFRARQVNNQSEREKIIASPASKLGSPPKRSRSAGRMNAAGVAAFYGAFDLETCIAEIRPAVGATIVGAAFELIRPVVVLDLTRFANPIQVRSRFSPVYEARSLQWGFMQSFVFEISKPILPDDVILDYIPSQAVSEFIHKVLQVKVDGQLCTVDAVIFPSAQHPEGKNIVLFGDAALVSGSPSADDPQSFELVDDETELWDDWKWEDPDPALAVKTDSVLVRRVNSVSFSHHEIIYDAGGHDDDF
ncbi:RES domain-containing protein [Sphingopyxis yananensis]|uniref:RES domain-containing protein n=1 Tax=Sphingopyxis yananensis TaxID=2886687 RepID=UPI001D127BA9|nr:RES domain-containing protein [Sphingopyxis yananensis]MCC2601596.1 RES domain-containing protein [Sphingopyxis yananensis]